MFLVCFHTENPKRSSTNSNVGLKVNIETESLKINDLFFHKHPYVTKGYNNVFPTQICTLI